MQSLSGSLEIENNPSELKVWEKLQDILKKEQGILGYRIPSLGTPNKEDIPSFIVRSSKFGIVVIDVVNSKINNIDELGDFWVTSEGHEIYSRDIIISQFYEQIINRLRKNTRIYDLKKRKLLFSEIRSYIIFPYNTKEEINKIWGLIQPMNDFISSDEIDEKLREEIFVDNKDFYIQPEILDTIDSLFEGTDRANQRTKLINKPENISDFIKKSLEYTFKLDEIQRKIAMQIPDGPQRIRGLAGTGKTVILSMKAALAHKDFPNYKILFVFNTQSMYNQIRKYISDYYIKETQENPNWNNLEVLHAWGGRSKEGLYSQIAMQYGVRPKTFMEVRKHNDPLEQVYIELLEQVKYRLEPMYDIVLIDEAQDFSPALFETIFYLTKEPKRIIWAYDEFQTLRELKIRESDNLFGRDKSGVPNLPEMKLEGFYKGEIEKDFVLPNSYRNPRINLMIAHGIGMGLYNQNEIIPIEDKASWMARGYQIIHPQEKAKFEYGDKIVVERAEEHSKNILESLLKENGKDEKELVKYQTFDDSFQELDKTVEEISFLINSQDVAPEEIIVINLETRKSEKEFEYLRRELDKREIKCITPGYIESSSMFKESGFVTLTTPFRAKGNEANVIFILNAQSVVDNPTYRMRNAFFVAATRSRGWCYIYSNGLTSTTLQHEIQSIFNDYPQFKFVFPRQEDVERRLELLSANKDLEKVENSIDNILRDETFKALLIEKMTRNEKITEELRQILKRHED